MPAPRLTYRDPHCLKHRPPADDAGAFNAPAPVVASVLFRSVLLMDAKDTQNIDAVVC